MKSYFDKRQQLAQERSEYERKINEVSSKHLLSDEGKAEEVLKIKTGYAEKLQAAANEAAQGMNAKQVEADNLLNKLQGADMEATQRAALELGPVIANMDYESLLRLYNARASNPAERKYIETVAQVRIDSDKHSGQLEGFTTKFNEDRQRIIDSMPGSNDLKHYQGQADYLNNLASYYSYNLQEWNGKRLQSPEPIKRRQAIHAVEQYEAANIKKPMTEEERQQYLNREITNTIYK